MSLDLSPSAPALWRQYLRWEVNVWFCLYKPHDDQCDCEICQNAYDEFINLHLIHRSRHEVDCDCDYCEPFSNFCFCEKCIPENPGDNFIHPLTCPPHATDCECCDCIQSNGVDSNYYDSIWDEVDLEEERRIEEKQERLEFLRSEFCS